MGFQYAHGSLTPMKNEPIRAVVLDLDGLMIDSESVYRRAFQNAASSQGRMLSNDDFADLVGRSNAWCEVELASRWGPGFDVERFRSEWTRHWYCEVTAGGAVLKAGAHELLAELERRGIPRAIASSAHRRDVELCLSTPRPHAPNRRRSHRG